MRLLVVESDPVLSRTLVQGLSAEKYIVDQAPDAERGLRLANGHDYAAIVLDSDLPDLHGLSVIRQIRGSGKGVRILYLSEPNDVSARVSGLQAGADECLSRPFVFQEFVARLHAVLRRPESLIDKLQVDDLEVDRMRRVVTRAGKLITLTQREYSVLEYLMRNAGKPVTRTMVVEHVWDLEFEGFANIVDVYITYLRAKIDRGFSRPLIHTARGIGYMLAAVESKASPRRSPNRRTDEVQRNAHAPVFAGERG